MTKAPFPAPEGLILALQQGPRREIPAGGYVQAAVLVALIRQDGDYELLLTRRTDEVETHKGQVAFPGGMRDHTDGTIVDTALREAEEELGILPGSVQIAGLLDDLVTPTGFVITPVVGILERIPTLALNAAEVADVFRAPLSFFADERNGRSERRNVAGKEYDVWFYDSGGHLVWGVTAGIIRMLLKTISGFSRPGTTPAA